MAAGAVGFEQGTDFGGECVFLRRCLEGGGREYRDADAEL